MRLRPLKIVAVVVVIARVVDGRHRNRSRWSVVGGLVLCRVASCRAVFFVVVDRKFLFEPVRGTSEIGL